MIASWKGTQILWKRRRFLCYLKSRNSSCQVHGVEVGLCFSWFPLKDGDDGGGGGDDDDGGGGGGDDDDDNCL
jgi:hypothetical protein